MPVQNPVKDDFVMAYEYKQEWFENEWGSEHDPPRPKHIPICCVAVSPLLLSPKGLGPIEKN